MKMATDLSEDKITKVFDMLDIDHDGAIDFDEFYLLICIITSFKVYIYLDMYTHTYTLLYYGVCFRMKWRNSLYRVMQRQSLNF